MGTIAVVINFSSFAALKLTTATNSALLLRLDLLFVVLIGQACGLERINLRALLTIPMMLAGLILLTEAHHFGCSSHLVGDVMVVVAALGLAVNAFVVRRILQRMDEAAAAFYNTIFTLVGFTALASYEGFAVSREIADQPEAWWWLIGLGIIAGVKAPLYYAALRQMPVWKLRMFLLLSPLLVALAEWALWGITLHVSQWLGAALLLGCALVLALDEARSNSGT